MLNIFSRSVAKPKAVEAPEPDPIRSVSSVQPIRSTSTPPPVAAPTKGYGAFPEGPATLGAFVTNPIATPELARNSVRRFFATMAMSQGGGKVRTDHNWRTMKVDRFFLSMSAPGAAAPLNVGQKACAVEAPKSLNDLFGDFNWD